MGLLSSATMQIALLGGAFFSRVRGYGWAAGPLGRAFWRYIFGCSFVTSCLQGHWGERFGGVFVFWCGCSVDSCSAAGPLGRAFWRCIFGWLLATPKLYHYYGLQGRRSWPQDGSNPAVRQPTWRLFFASAWLWLSCRATGESVLEVHFWMFFRYVVLAGPLGRAFWRYIFG